MGQQQQSRPVLLPARSGRDQPDGGVTGVVGQTDADAGIDIAASSSSRNIGGDTSMAGAAGVAAPMPDKAADATGATNQQAAAGTTQQQQQATVPSGSLASFLAASETAASKPVSASASGPAATGEMTVSGRKRAAAAAKAEAKAKAKQQEEEAAAAAAASSSSSVFAQMSRAERKSRQAMEKLGLRTVKGVFRMTMRTNNGAVFVVKAPDVFKHPQQVDVDSLVQR